MYFEINGSHLLNLNQTYPLLPGESLLRLAGSELNHSVTLSSGLLEEITVRSVRVDLDCPPWDWNCLGSKKVFLYKKDEHYPFASGVTDVPLLYFDEEAYLSIEGSRDIRFQLPTRSHHIVRAGRVRLVPKPELRTGLVTDLVRFESTNFPF